MERIIGLLHSHGEKGSRIDVAVTIMDEDSSPDVMDFAGRLRNAGLRTEVYLGSSRKLAKQLKWAAERRASFALIYGQQERGGGLVTVRDMDSGEQNHVSIDELASHLKERCAASR
ncbi:His/Gly/Thr/Pro-type tRNA ligase C-terminal domain-containing protein [Acrocarpospora sp. B8E8]|uniref:His/Gly/Thr/Pro-type tRNA ligase C-terminal domain-containing protein n=1 Tax=Acrocarpospora sp. B8E8 TaxID=3153572 RepID=UPI00325E64DA